MTEDPSPPSNAANSVIDAYLRQAREDRKKISQETITPVLEPKARAMRTALIGTAVGITISLVFSIVSIGGNMLLLPGLPLYRSFLSPVITVTVTTIFVTLFSLISVSSVKIQNRVVVALLMLLALAVTYNLYHEYGNIVAGIMEGLGFFYIFIIPILFFFLCLAPFGMFVRWVINAQVKYFYRPVCFWKRAVPLLVMLGVAVLAGSLCIYSRQEQKVIRDMDRMIRQSMEASTKEDMPQMIQGITGAPFYPFAQGSYYLIAEHNPLPKRVTFSGEPYQMEIFVSAKFESGYWFTCRFTRWGVPLWCETDYVPPLPTVNG